MTALSALPNTEPEFDEPFTFAGRYGDALGQFGPQYPVLGFEVLDHRRQLRVRSRSEQEPQRLEQARHDPCGRLVFGARHGFCTPANGSMRRPIPKRGTDGDRGRPAQVGCKGGRVGDEQYAEHGGNGLMVGIFINVL